MKKRRKNKAAHKGNFITMGNCLETYIRKYQEFIEYPSTLVRTSQDPLGLRAEQQLS